MNIYELSFGIIRKFIVAESEQEAYNIGTDPNKHPDLHFRAFEIVPVEVEGWEITAKRKGLEEKQLDEMNRDELKQWLNEKRIDYTPQWGEQKLRELALSHV